MTDKPVSRYLLRKSWEAYKAAKAEADRWREILRGLGAKR